MASAPRVRLPPVVTVKLTEDDYRVAEEYEKRVLAKVSHYDNYTGQSWPNRYRNGHLAEIGMNRWLSESGVRYEWLTRDDGHADKCDFLFHTGYKPLAVDIKVSSSLDSTELIVGEKQWRKCVHRYFGLVAARLNHRRRELWMFGWMTTKAFAEAAPPVERDGRLQRIYDFENGLQDMARLIA